MYADIGDRPKVERWDTIEVLHRSNQAVEGGNLGVTIEVQQPVFEDGRKGRVKLGCAIQRGERTLRIPCRDGGTSEIMMIAQMLQDVATEENLKSYEERFREIEEANRPPERRSYGGGTAGNYSEPGMGLARFSGKSDGSSPKRAKRRERRGHESAED